MNNEKLEQFSLLKRAVAHIRAQGEPSYSEDAESCKYTITTHSKVLHCAAWPFIVKYKRDMDDMEKFGGSWRTLVEHYAKDLDPMAVKHDDFVVQIQQCHDTAAESTLKADSDIDDDGFMDEFMEKFEKNVKVLCSVYDLPYGEL